MHKGAGILIKALYIIYIGVVSFFCFFHFSSSMPDLGRDLFGIRLDRYAHFLLFFPFPFLCFLTLRYTKSFRPWSNYSLIITLVIGLAFGAATEIIQDKIFPFRQGDILDFVADSMSIVLGTLLVHLVGDKLAALIDRLFRNKDHIS